MSNIFLFRHGHCLDQDSDDERLSPLGIEQAGKAGEIVADKINWCMGLICKNKVEEKELEGLLKVHSGRPRTFQFLEKVLYVAGKKFNGELGLGGNRIEITSPGIYKDNPKDSLKNLKQIMEYCSVLAGTQLIVGHGPIVTFLAKGYINQGFNFEGDETFLDGTPKGRGYWINTLEKKVEAIDYPD